MLSVNERSVINRREHFAINTQVGDTTPDSPLRVYAGQRQVAKQVLANAVSNGEDPSVVAKAVVAAVNDKNPKLRYTAGTRAARISTLRRLVPAGAFDKPIRKINQLTS
jgi:hypothetical protein